MNMVDKLKLGAVFAIGIGILGYAVYSNQSFGKGTYRGPAPSQKITIGERFEYSTDTQGNKIKTTTTWYRNK